MIVASNIMNINLNLTENITIGGACLLLEKVLITWRFIKFLYIP